MFIKKDLYNKILLYVGDVEMSKTYFPIDEVDIENYSKKDIYDHISLMIEGNIIQGIFAEHESSPNYGYLIGGLTTDSRYIYHQLKKKLEK